MPNRKKLPSAASRRKTRKKDASALKNIVSLRISDQEKRVLEGITRSSRKNVSDVVREAIEFWLARRDGLGWE